MKEDRGFKVNETDSASDSKSIAQLYFDRVVASSNGKYTLEHLKLAFTAGGMGAILEKQDLEAEIRILKSRLGEK
jgi:hypothetical protein